MRKKKLMERLLQDAKEKILIHESLVKSYKSFAEFLEDELKRTDEHEF